jgi:DNA-binding IclR family transcriptional regulator
MKLLDHFSVSRPELGLSELARLCGFDKAATRRFLVALSNHGFIEQNPETRKYRLGPGFIRLARIREAMFPVAEITQPIVNRLTKQSGETAHVGVAGTGALTTIAYCEPKRGTIVHIDPGEALPYHATASGIVYLGFSSQAFRDRQLAKPLPAFAKGTVIDRAAVLKQAERAYEHGFQVSESSFEDEVSGVAVPFFDASGDIAGTIAIASPSSRLNTDRIAAFKVLLLQASEQVTKAFGGTLHPHVARLAHALEAAE